MKQSTFTDEQSIYALRQTEQGVTAAEVCRNLGISEHTFYRWKKRFADMGVAELHRLRQLEEENRTLKQLVADLSLDNICCKRCCEKSSEAGPEAGTCPLSAHRLSHQ